MEEKATRKTLDPQDIARITQMTTEEDVNTCLDQGWVIIGMSSAQHSEHGFSLTYHLGWPRELGAPPEPPLKGWKKFMVQAKARESVEDEDGPEIPF